MRHGAAHRPERGHYADADYMSEHASRQRISRPLRAHQAPDSLRDAVVDVGGNDDVGAQRGGLRVAHRHADARKSEHLDVVLRVTQRGAERGETARLQQSRDPVPLLTLAGGSHTTARRGAGWWRACRRERRAAPPPYRASMPIRSPGLVQITNLTTRRSSKPSRLGRPRMPARSMSCTGRSVGCEFAIRQRWPWSAVSSALLPAPFPGCRHHRHATLCQSITASMMSRGSCASQITSPAASITTAPLPKTHGPRPGSASRSSSDHGPGSRPVARQTWTSLAMHSKRICLLAGEISRPAKVKRVPSMSLTTARMPPGGTTGAPRAASASSPPRAEHHLNNVTIVHTSISQ